VTSTHSADLRTSFVIEKLTYSCFTTELRLMNLTSLWIGIESGIALGSIYALVGLGFTLVVASTRLFIFALESLVSGSGIAAYLLVNDDHWPTAAVVAVVCVGGALVGVIFDLIVYRPLNHRVKDLGLAVLIATIGISIAADGLLNISFGSNSLSVDPYISPVPFFIDHVPIQKAMLVMVGVLLIVVLTSEIVMAKTHLGAQLTVLQEDPTAARLMGMSVNTMITGIFAVSGLLTALAGFLITPISFASYDVGSTLMIPTFAALAIGGFGSFRGAVVGAMIVGLFEGLAPLKISPNDVNPLLLIIMVLILLARPQGLFGRPELVREF
jgi:branched-chain amino acid transport system permease protein